jgi:hypothetical protein
MNKKDTYLQDILSTTPSSAQKGYDMVRAVCAQNPTLGQQIVEDLIQKKEPHYQLLGLHGVALLGSSKWESLVLKLTQHANPEVINSALRALGFVGTESSMTHLMALARQDYDGALWALKKLVSKFPEYSTSIFELAEGLLLSENAQVREQATAIIVKLGKTKEAEARLVKSAETFADEFTLNALQEASLAVLPNLERLKNRFTPEGAEYHDLERTINAIEKRQRPLLAKVA